MFELHDYGIFHCSGAMIHVFKNKQALIVDVPLTPSKSITNRTLIINALTGNKIEILNASSSSDSLFLHKALNSGNNVIDVGDAGTAFRFLTAFLSFQKGDFLLTGSSRMKNRPIGKLVSALRLLGADIEFQEKQNYPPLLIKGRQLAGGQISIDGSESSQFISAILMIAPLLSGGLQINLTGKINSLPYISMTLSLMKYFGIEYSWYKSEIKIPEAKYSPKAIKIENDWSSASFWYSIAALSDSANIRLNNLHLNSIQGDAIMPEIFNYFNVETKVAGDDIILLKRRAAPLPTKFEYDFSNIPDLVIPVAFVCAALKIPGNFKGVENLRIKESDRLVALQTELAKLGGEVLLSKDSFILKTLPKTYEGEVFHSYDDHRMVMAEACMAVAFSKISIDDHLPVKKSYPEFWNHIQNAGFDLEII